MSSTRVKAFTLVPGGDLLGHLGDHVADGDQLGLIHRIVQMRVPLSVSTQSDDSGAYLVHAASFCGELRRLARCQTVFEHRLTRSRQEWGGD
jgi:hypothetical protein